MVFPTFFNLSLNLAIRSSWSEPQSAPGCFCWLYRDSPYLAAENRISLILVLTIWRCPFVESSNVVGKPCLLYQCAPVCYTSFSLGKTLLAFVLLHFVLQRQTSLWLQLSLDFLILHSSPLWWKGHLFFFFNLFLEGIVGSHFRTIKLQLLWH